MRGGYEIVHGVLDMIQPHEQWEYTTNINPFPPPPTITTTTTTTFPKPTTERNELSDWVEHVTKQLIDDLPETTTDSFQTDDTLFAEFRPRKVPRNNYHHHQQQQQQPQLDIINGHDEIQWGVTTTTSTTATTELNRADEHGLNLLTLLLESAVAISVDNLGEGHRMLLELTQMASPYSSSCAERIVAYFAKSMANRVTNSWLGICSPLINYESIHSTYQIFNSISPFIKFAHFTSNQAILEAFHGRTRVHIIDLDIMQGLQWPALFHILATRIEGPPHLRMTGIGNSMNQLLETGKQLSNFAKRLGISFEFHPISKKFGEIDISTIQPRKGETIAIHWNQHSMYDTSGSDHKTLKLMENLSPKLITLIEQDLTHSGSFLDRFVSALHYYSTIFDSLGAFAPSDDLNRHKVEHHVLHREINNILAIGGPARSGEEKFKQWRDEMGKSGGLKQVVMSGNSMAQAQLIVNMFPSGNGFRVLHGDGMIRVGWKDTCLFTASAWTCSSHFPR